MQLTMLQAIGSGASPAAKVGSLRLDADYVRRFFAALLPSANLSGIYGAFLSYRHGVFASNAVEAAYRFLTLQVLGGRVKVEVFRDSVDLKSGLSFDQSFLEAMLRTQVVVPLITPDTLARMKKPECLTEIDHVQLEWKLALYLLELPGFPVLRVAPILCGTVRPACAASTLAPV